MYKHGEICQSVHGRGHGTHGQQRVVGTQPKHFRSQLCVVGTIGPMDNLT